MTQALVDEYLERLPEPQRGTLSRLRETLRELLPNAEESLSYGVPALKIDGKPVAGYAAFKRHCSYFPHSGSVLPRLEADLAAYTWSKGTLRFPIDQPLAVHLVRRLVEVKLAELGVPTGHD
jgi:uncharacterized protein YdhG (YjbR/CyaY superfamily)